MTDLTHIIAEWRENGTPGPWEMNRINHLDGTAEMSFANNARDKAGKEWLSEAWFDFARAWIRQRGAAEDYPTGKANAALIAAAPAMADRIEALEAENARLRKTVEASAMLGNIVGWLGDDIDRIEALKAAMEPGLIERARAALNKEPPK